MEMPEVFLRATGGWKGKALERYRKDRLPAAQSQFASRLGAGVKDDYGTTSINQRQEQRPDRPTRGTEVHSGGNCSLPSSLVVEGLNAPAKIVSRCKDLSTPVKAVSWRENVPRCEVRIRSRSARRPTRFRAGSVASVKVKACRWVKVWGATT